MGASVSYRKAVMPEKFSLSWFGGVYIYALFVLYKVPCPVYLSQQYFQVGYHHFLEEETQAQKSYQASTHTKIVIQLRNGQKGCLGDSIS